MNEKNETTTNENGEKERLACQMAHRPGSVLFVFGKTQFIMSESQAFYLSWKLFRHAFSALMGLIWAMLFFQKEEEG